MRPSKNDKVRQVKINIYFNKHHPNMFGGTKLDSKIFSWYELISSKRKKKKQKQKKCEKK